MTRSADTRDIAPPQTDIPPSPAGQTATETGQLPLNGLVLIGIAGKPDSLIALLRARDGKILSVRTGDATPGGRVAAIGPNEVHLTRNGGNTTRLLLPD
jgi:type IV pilus biogenesis protein PilP